MRYSIRDLFWATLVVAMGFGWWVNQQATEVKSLAAVEQAHKQRAALVEAKEFNDYLMERFVPNNILPIIEMDWSILDEPLVEP